MSHDTELPDSAVRRRFATELRVDAAPPVVFPLLCPVRERDWIVGWDAAIRFSRSGLAEAGCVFQTGHGPEAITWIVHRHKPPRRIGFTLIAADRWIELLDIEVAPTATGATLTWTREATALATDGVAAIADRFTAYPDRHRRLEAALRHYLATGQALAEAS